MYHQVFDLHAELLKALAHPKRLEILHLLRDSEMSVSQIQEMLDLPQGNLSQHLSVLRDAGVLITRRAGKHIYYRLAHTNFMKASDLMRDVLVERYKDDPLADEFTQKMTDLVPLTSDPVCGMRVSPKTASYGTKHNGVAYYFCASGCLEKFVTNPKNYDKK